MPGERPSADVVVIGAGVIGSSIALELAREGHRVVVLDRAAGAGQGSTSASSAIVRFNFSTTAGVATAWEAHFGWLDWAGHLGHDVGDLAVFRKSGLVMLDVEAAPRASWLPLFDEIGVPYEEWDSATLAERVPGIDVGRYWPPKRLDDWTPIYDRTELDGFYVAIGTSGNQFKNAPVVGQLMTELINQVENGLDHDAVPIRFRAPRTGLEINLGAFSRRRNRNSANSGTVMG
ncbi:FAD-dependent oxidoreductase [Amycolatopsis sp. NPDC021455]|uniref:NAD(P)/FAD-dependent oxidoreductase n=1 Tax=Amycolatopsis sp. NPDC021455 TaxID=3154901 RepID=UPI0033C2C9C9